MNRISSVALAFTLAGFCGACGPTSPAETAEAQARAGAVRPSALPEAFDSTGCVFHGAVYTAHPEWVGPEEAFSYRLTVERPGENRFSYEARLVFEARDLETGKLATTLRLEHTTGNGLARHAASSAGDAVSADVHHLNRNLGFGSQGEVAEGQLPAPYALLFSDLKRELYYLPKGWEPLGGDVTFHTPARARSLFPNMWVLQTCGGRVKVDPSGAPGS